MSEWDAKKLKTQESYRALPPLHVTLAYLKGLPNYSISLPTGTTPGTRWRREVHYQPWGWRSLPRIGWMIGEYYEGPNVPLGSIGIHWYRPVIRVRAGIEDTAHD